MASPLSSLKYLNLGGIDLHKETNWLPFVATMLPSLSELHLSACDLNDISPSLEYVNLTSLANNNLQHLDLSSNMFCGSNIPSILGNLSSLITLSIGSNDFSDPEWIPPFQLSILHLGNTNQDGDKFSRIVEGIDELDLSNNSLKGDISNVTLNASFIFLDHNNFTGRLPRISPMVIEMDLSHNSFSGSIPRYWENMKYLSRINLWRKNEFSGTIPTKMPQALEVIILRANQFEGNIPTEFQSLSSLFHLDLSHNKLSGSLPQRTVDLSANNLSGEIPSELFEQLIQVQTLNLSYNHFMGTIPKTIGGMKNLESLDLSNNKLSELCGAPLKKCTTEGEEEDPENRKHPEDGSDPLRESLYLGMGVGFAVGFWGICGSLLLIRKWRHTYYRFLDRVADKLYVTWMLNLSTC
ncbi:Leucine-rich repeat [Sesbania bispinosa]|nr:Leucine-rich repeat [Sesbania bispinosa]